MRGEEIAYRGTNEDGDEGVFFVSVGQYPSGEPLVRERPQEVKRILLRPRSMTGLLGGLFWAEAMDERDVLHRDCDLVMPFVPGARQDRMNSQGDALFTAKSIARLINAAIFGRVTILDPHSDVIAGLIDRCEVVHAADIVGAGYDVPWAKYDAIVSPDAGAEKRAGAVAGSLGVSMIHAWKTRDVRTGSIAGFGMEPGHMRNMRLLVVDDICDGGGTFIGLSDVIRDRGASADLYVTHGLFTKGTDELLSRFINVFCTDSVVSERPGIHVIPMCQNDLL